MASFSFSFSGDDIDGDTEQAGSNGCGNGAQSAAAAPSAFPVQGKPLLPPLHLDLHDMLAKLPSKIAYSALEVDLDGKGSLRLPRRELWDVRVQLMAEADVEHDEAEPGMGDHDVKTGIYEGGFKSWESSVDLVKVLSTADEWSPISALKERPLRIVELGCGTALPSLAVFQWAMVARLSHDLFPLSITLADYNPSVLQLVTLPNFILAWSLQQRDRAAVLQGALEADGELELTQEVKDAFQAFLSSSKISLSFVSGGWSPDFVDLISQPSRTAQTLLIGAETIYSPFALSAFSETVLSILRREHDQNPETEAAAIVAAKRLYFGVGGSLDDFVEKMRGSGSTVQELREETEGVRRGVVRCVLA